MQPAWADDHVKYVGSGPALQVEQSHALTSPEVKLGKEFSQRSIDWLAQFVKQIDLSDGYPVLVDL